MGCWRPSAGELRGTVSLPQPPPPCCPPTSCHLILAANSRHALQSGSNAVSKNAIKALAAACGLNENAVTDAAAALLPLWPGAAALPPPAGPLPVEAAGAEAFPADLNAFLLGGALQNALLLPLPDPAQSADLLGLTPPGWPLGSTPFNTGLAADSLTFMSQQLPVSPVQFRWDPAFLSQLSSAPMQAPAPQQAPASSRKRRRQRPASPS